MAISTLHEFHFLVTRSMKESLEKITIFKGVKTFSGIIVQILLLLSPVMKQEHRWGEQRDSRYLPVGDDPEEKRDHARAYLPNEVYKELKLMHQDLNCYSIAQLVREFLSFFLLMVAEYGNDVLQVLGRMYKNWEKEIDNKKPTLRQYMRQLWVIIQHLPGKNRLLQVYNRDYSPFWNLRL